jgi:hypothetical protein
MTRRFCPDPHHIGGSGKRRGPQRTPEEHRRAVAALQLAPEPPRGTVNRLGKEGFRRVLRELGFDLYADYLLSALWLDIRRRVMKRARKKCFDCDGRATQVHHEEYTVENLKGLNLRFLVALCDGCHHRRHGLHTPYAQLER